MQPGAETSVALTISDAAGRPVAGAGVALAVVDEAAPAVGDPVLDDPLASFPPTRAKGLSCDGFSELDPEHYITNIVGEYGLVPNAGAWWFPFTHYAGNLCPHEAGPEARARTTGRLPPAPLPGRSMTLPRPTPGPSQPSSRSGAAARGGIGVIAFPNSGCGTVRPLSPPCLSLAAAFRRR